MVLCHILQNQVHFLFFEILAGLLRCIGVLVQYFHDILGLQTQILCQFIHFILDIAQLGHLQ